ncbi:pilin [Photobacterium kishitanii]|uniref:pilin n=1 Tax=Photobacterium kishitanii TaxID=318456 RepID=UPI000D17A243|nr:pilin [Photobacterium kishitanii]PSV24447.1 prepilin-type cleavage/methylation domain-containing protein [Photobacterium kishitanii]
MNKQQGFTLIELMIVVAVIGVLSAIAIPQYQKYVAKAEGAAALATLTGLKTNVEAYTVENGKFPINSIASDIGVPSAALGNITLPTASTDATGAITFTYKADKVSPLNSGGTLVLNRSDSGEWTCAGTAKDDSVGPKGCALTELP